MQSIKNIFECNLFFHENSFYLVSYSHEHMLKRKCDLDLSSSLHLWWVMMSYALTPLTPVWCEVNVLSLSLSLSLLKKSWSTI